MSFLDDYEPVEDRLRDFWSEHPDGRVVTKLVMAAQDPGHIIIFKASVYRKLDPDGEPAATGYAHQRILDGPPLGRNGKPNESAPEWTSPYEVAETSAIGRALANMGYAAKGKRPSREEISKASRSSTAKGTGTPAAESLEGGTAAGTTSADGLPLPSTEQAGSDGDQVSGPPRGRGPCLHLSGSKPHTTSSGRVVEVCMDCGRPVEGVAR